VKLITIEGDVFRADRIEAIAVNKLCQVCVVVSGFTAVTTMETLEEARAAQLRAVTDWKKALE
jgi:hypothetical protein